MKTSQIYDELSNRSLDDSLLEIQEIIEDVKRNKQLKSYNSLADLKLPDTATLTQIVEAMPSMSVFVLDVAPNTHTGIDVPASGVIEIVRGSVFGKAYIKFSNESILLFRMYNTYFSNPLQGWISYGQCSYSITAASIGNQLSNAKIWGADLYVSAGQAGLLTDKPSDFTGSYGFCIRNTRFSASETEWEQELIENNRAGRKWRRVSAGAAGFNEWQPVPALLKSGQRAFVRVGDYYIDDSNIMYLLTPSGMKKL